MSVQTEKVELRELVKAHYGKALKQESRNSEGAVDVFGSSGCIGRHDQVLFDYPSIVVGRKGSVGALTFAPNGGWVIDTAYYLDIVDKSVLDLRYLYYALNALDLAKDTITTSIPGLSRDALLDNLISLPPLEEQKRIAAILDKTDSLRRKRAQAIALADDFLRATFLEMFGDPVTNPKGWPVKKFGDLGANNKYAIKAGPFGSALKKEFYVSSGYRIYGQEQVIRDDLFFGDYYIDEEKFRELESCKVAAGDLLISLVGTFGKISIVPSEFEPGIINPRLMKVSLNEERARPIFIKALLTSDSMKRQIESFSHGGTMGIVNVGIMKNLDVPVPPIATQIKFERVLEQVAVIKAKMDLGTMDMSRITTSINFSCLNK